MIWLCFGIVGVVTVVGIGAFLDGVTELPSCIKGCHLDLSTGAMWHSPGCASFEQTAEEERVRQAGEDEAQVEADYQQERGAESDG